MKPPFAKTLKETSFARVQKVWLVIRSEVAVESLENVSLTPTALTLLCVKARNAEIHAKLLTLVEPTRFVALLATLSHVDVHQAPKAILRSHVTPSNALTTMNANCKSLASTPNVSIHALCQMLAAKTQSAQLKIMSEFVRACLEQLETHCWAASNFNTAVRIISAQHQQNATMEFATPSAPPREIVWLTNFVFRMSVNRPAKATQLVQTSNSVRTTFAFKNQSARLTRIVKSEKNAQKTPSDDRNAEMLALEEVCVAGTLSASREIMTPSANANKDSTRMEKSVGRSSASRTMTVATTRDARTTCARSSALWESHAVKMPSAQPKTTNKFANASLDTSETRKCLARSSTSVKAHLVDLAQPVRTTADHTNVPASLDLLEMPQLWDASGPLNVKSMTTVQRQPSVFRRTEFQNVEMFVKLSLADQMLSAKLKIMLRSAYAATAMMEILKTRWMDANQSQVHATRTLTVHLMLTAMD
jgi:hypothetical protein